jgi:FAD dependent oxidoreductase TIGR03364
MSQFFDAAVVGAGILGLAHAYQLARRGIRVLVLERGPRAQGASIRNFGMIWPIGQPAGEWHQLALRSREIWLDLLRQTGLWHHPAGSLHLAYRVEEWQVLKEFASSAPTLGYDCELLDPREVRRHSPMVQALGLVGGLFSPTEICVDPREVISSLPGWLHDRYGVTFEFGRVVIGYEQPRVVATDGSWEAERLFVCTGDDFLTLFPETYRGLGLQRCKLQMMRTEPLEAGRSLGPMLAAGLTLRHYKSFASCPSLTALRAMFARERPEFDRFGIHVMASQNGRGELVLGDSHEYDADIEPFDKVEIDNLVLDYLTTFLDVPGIRIASRWHGTYAKHPTNLCLVAEPVTGAIAVTAVGGAGMTLSFGLAEQVVRQAYSENRDDAKYSTGCP